MDAARFNYSFVIWPDETWKFHADVFKAFEALGARVELAFTEPEFEQFRSNLSHHGLTLREVERVPFVEPEPVF